MSARTRSLDCRASDSGKYLFVLALKVKQFSRGQGCKCLQSYNKPAKPQKRSPVLRSDSTVAYLTSKMASSYTEMWSEQSGWCTDLIIWIKDQKENSLIERGENKQTLAFFDSQHQGGRKKKKENTFNAGEKSFSSVSVCASVCACVRRMTCWTCKCAAGIKNVPQPFRGRLSDSWQCNLEYMTAKANHTVENQIPTD